jgi:hypothetical protein
MMDADEDADEDDDDGDDGFAISHMINGSSRRPSLSILF